MRPILLALLLGICFSSTAQEVHTFKPQWEKGTEKVLTMAQVERDYENDALISDTTIYNEATIRVVDVSATHYRLEVTYENQALRAATVLYDRMGEELKEYRDLVLVLSLDKHTAEAELLNWKEAQKFMDGSIEQITRVLKKKTPEMAPMAKLVFLPIQEIFKSQENVEAYMLDNIGYMLLPFQHAFQLNEPLISTNSQANPFSPMQEIASTTIVTLKSMDVATGQCVIEQELQLDLSPFIEMMKAMMKSMAGAAGANEQVTNAKAEEMNDFELGMTQVKSIYYNAQSTWVEKVVTTGLVTGTDPKDGTRTRKEIVSTTTVM